MPTIIRLLVPFLLLTAGCSSGGSNTSTPAASPELGDVPRVRIENRASLDMDIFVIRRDGQRVRLGFVSGGDNAVFALPPAITAGATSITFEARPVRRSGQSVVSEPFGVREGEEITWSVPPQ